MSKSKPMNKKIAVDEEKNEGSVSSVEDEDSENEGSENEGSEMFEDELNMADLMQTFFAGDNGKNIVDTLDCLRKSVDSQNKILMKIGGILEKKFSTE
jgi:hypothetical protein